MITKKTELPLDPEDKVMIMALACILHAIQKKDVIFSRGKWGI